MDFSLFSALAAEGNDEEGDDRHAYTAGHIDPCQVILLFDSLLAVNNLGDFFDFDDLDDLGNVRLQPRVVVCESVPQSELGSSARSTRIEHYEVKRGWPTDREALAIR